MTVIVNVCSALAAYQFSGSDDEPTSLPFTVIFTSPSLSPVSSVWLSSVEPVPPSLVKANSKLGLVALLLTRVVRSSL